APVRRRPRGRPPQRRRTRRGPPGRVLDPRAGRGRRPPAATAGEVALMLLGLLLGGLGRDALRLAAALAAVVLVAIVFGIAAAAAIWGALTGVRGAADAPAVRPVAPI